MDPLTVNAPHLQWSTEKIIAEYIQHDDDY